MNIIRTPRLLTAATLLILASLSALADGWTTNYANALQQAKTDNKAILLNFTGSDWCPWCKKMKTEVFEKQDFNDYAGQNLELVMLDFPNSVPQPLFVKQQNQKLSQKFKIQGFPTFILLNSDGRVLWTQVGYLAGGSPAFLDQLRKHYQSAPAASPADDFDSFFKKPAQSPTP